MNKIKELENEIVKQALYLKCADCREEVQQVSHELIRLVNQLKELKLKDLEIKYKK